MNTSSTGTAGERPLEVLGIVRDEEKLYRWLLSHPAASASDTAKGLGLPRATAQRLLDTIETKGLATHTPERPRRYLAASPDIALEALALRHQEKLQHVRSTIEELQQEAAIKRNKGNERVVEMITSHEAENQIFADLHRSAHDEILTLTRPPLRVTRLDTDAKKLAQLQQEAQARGVAYRSIVDAQFLASPGAPTRIRREAALGEQFRVAPTLPFKMVVADRRIAIIPLHLEQSNSASLLVRSSALLDALCAMFEMLWTHAAPITFNASNQPEAGTKETRIDACTEDIVSLMATGLNDKSIARELHISSSTLNRRIARAMYVFNARSRFQLGWLARGNDNTSE